MKLSNKQKGFTLIELIITILIISVLASFAIPKYANLKTEATETMVDNLHGSILSASNTIFAEAVLTNKESSASGDSLSIKGATVNLTYGYPSANTRSVSGMLSFDDSYTISRVDAETMLISFQDKDECGVTYKVAASTSDEPTLTKLKTGC